MRLSIITVTYNSSRYLEETVKSVLSQDWPDLEYILVDGGSTDGTLAIIKRHAGRDSRVRWISERDEGISDAFNKGIGMATGAVIGIINSDDSYAPGALRAVAEASRLDPESDIFHGDVVRLEGEKPVFRLKPADIDRRIWREMPLNHAATFVTRRAYERVGVFDKALRTAMDYDLVLRLYKANCRFAYVDKVLAFVRYGGESDYRFMNGLKEVFAVSVREGCPYWKACLRFTQRVMIVFIKNMLRRFGLYRLIRLHPRFRDSAARDD